MLDPYAARHLSIDDGAAGHASSIDVQDKEW